MGVERRLQVAGGHRALWVGNGESLGRAASATLLCPPLAFSVAKLAPRSPQAAPRALAVAVPISPGSSTSALDLQGEGRRCPRGLRSLPPRVCLGSARSQGPRDVDSRLAWPLGTQGPIPKSPGLQGDRNTWCGDARQIQAGPVQQTRRRRHQGPLGLAQALLSRSPQPWLMFAAAWGPRELSPPFWVPTLRRQARPLPWLVPEAPLSF